MTQQLKEFAENLGTLLEEYDNLQRELACYREDLQEMQEALQKVRRENNILWDMLPEKKYATCEECAVLRIQCQGLHADKLFLKSAAHNLAKENTELRERIKSLDACLAAALDRGKRRRTMYDSPQETKRTVTDSRVLEAATGAQEPHVAAADASTASASSPAPDARTTAAESHRPDERSATLRNVPEHSPLCATCAAPTSQKCSACQTAFLCSECQTDARLGGRKACPMCKFIDTHGWRRVYGRSSWPRDTTMADDI